MKFDIARDERNMSNFTICRVYNNREIRHFKEKCRISRFFSENVPEINEILQSSIELSNRFDKYDVAVKKGGKVVAHNCVSNHMKSYNTK